MFQEIGGLYENDAEWQDKTLAILSIGLDGFKAINESFGHAKGDAVLQILANRIKDAVGSHSAVVSRYGGDHFTVALLSYKNVADVESLSQQLLHTLAEPVSVDNQQVILTASIGIALKNQPNDGFELLVIEAESAMNEAKIQGRNRFLFFHQDLLSFSQSRLRIENALRRAVKQQQGFHIEYQPQLDCRSGKVCGAEALVRWHDAELGPMSPADFIPIAEHTGLIVPLGYWIFQQVLTDIKSLEKQGFDLPCVSINLSGRQFEEPELLERLLKILQQTGIEAAKIDLELTESTVMRNPRQGIKILQSFKQQNMSVSIDDFGVAYSSLSYLKSLPASRLKIDQSFIRDIVSHKDDKAITTSIIELGHNLGLKVIAEGVETAAQRDLLKELGCDEIQGFYYSRPLTLDRLIAFLKLNA